MKKTILLFLAITFSIHYTNAQFNATWEETTTFIQTYSHELYNYNSSSCKSEYNEVSIKGKELNVKFKFLDGSGEVITKVDLSKLKNVSYEDTFFVIELTGDYIQSSYDDGKTFHDNNSNKMNISFCNNEIMDRVYRAFKQLTILATERRK